jgi:hypothetical protein
MQRKITGTKKCDVRSKDRKTPLRSRPGESTNRHEMPRWSSNVSRNGQETPSQSPAESTIDQEKPHLSPGGPMPMTDQEKARHNTGLRCNVGTTIAAKAAARAGPLSGTHQRCLAEIIHLEIARGPQEGSGGVRPRREGIAWRIDRARDEAATAGTVPGPAALQAIELRPTTRIALAGVVSTAAAIVVLVVDTKGGVVGAAPEKTIAATTEAGILATGIVAATTTAALATCRLRITETVTETAIETATVRRWTATLRGAVSPPPLLLRLARPLPVGSTAVAATDRTHAVAVATSRPRSVPRARGTPGTDRTVADGSRPATTATGAADLRRLPIVDAPYSHVRQLISRK